MTVKINSYFARGKFTYNMLYLCHLTYLIIPGLRKLFNNFEEY